MCYIVVCTCLQRYDNFDNIINILFTPFCFLSQVQSSGNLQVSKYFQSVKGCEVTTTYCWITQLYCLTQLSIGVTDERIPERIDTVSVFVTVTRDNFPPLFDLPSYSAVIPENTPAGDRILTVQATDADKVVRQTYCFF